MANGQAMSTLYDDAELYDLVAPPDEEMERFYVGAALERGRSVLELACGTGRFTRPIAAAGAQVTAGDLSATMLDRARQVLDAMATPPKLHQLDMRDFDLGRHFDTIILAANSLMHLHTHDDFATAFSTIRRHLKADGRFVFDIFVPSAVLLSHPPDERQLLGRFEHTSLGQVTVEETITYDPMTQISHTNWFWSTPHHPDFRQTSMDLRQIYPQELPLLLNLGGLRLLHRFGDFTGSEPTARSFRQVCIAVTA